MTTTLSQDTFHPSTRTPHHQEDSHHTQQAMDATINPEEGPAYESSLIQEAKTLIEKLNTMAQRASAQAAHEHTHVEPTVPDDFTDNASEFSGYSLLTPSATSKSERTEEKSRSDQQVTVDEQSEFDEIPELVPGELIPGDLDFNLDVSGFDHNGEGSQPINQVQEDDKNVSQIESKPENKPLSKKRKLIGIVITFDQGVDFDEGQTAVRFISDHLGLSCGSQVREMRVLSIEGDGHLEVSTPPRPESQPGSIPPGHEAVELVAKIHCIAEEDGQEDRIQGRVATVSSIRKSSTSSALVESASLPVMPTDRTTLLHHRTELAKARTVRALVGSRSAACSGNCLDPDVQGAAKFSGIDDDSDTSPTLSQLINIAKAEIYEELTHRDCLITSGVAKKIITKQEGTKTIHTKLTEDKGISDIHLVGGWLIVVVLLLCIMAMIAAPSGHCVGFWVGA